MNLTDTDSPVDQRAGFASISWVLLTGLLLSIVVMVVGLIAAVVSGHGATSVLPLDQEFLGLARGNANAILDLGILLLFATPLAGVVSAFIAFWAQRDHSFLLITGALLVMFVVVFAIALH